MFEFTATYDNGRYHAFNVESWEQALAHACAAQYLYGKLVSLSVSPAYPPHTTKSQAD